MEGAHEAPGYGGTPGVPGDAETIQLPPTKLLQHQSARRGSDQAPVKALAGCGMWPSDEGSRPRGQRRRTADPTGRLPPGIRVSGMASGHRSTDSNGAGRQKAPGLQSPQRRHQGGARREPPHNNQAGHRVAPEGTQGTARGGGHGGDQALPGPG
ncbi:hypothetical protein N7530_010734 [Penicillium desertorum]|uniref:Uncharacterized protein n=1 Tax=Penicillium desertorum TaxID=1303715 RepID=A0A9W9WGB4_9EURO|nr:hypothetical protein N7530_010734 [Penicillium desertorum]